MSQIITLDNFSNLLASNIVGRTTLTSDIAADVNSLPVANSADFAAGPVLIGQPDGPTTEQTTATAPSNATALPLSAATKLAHNINDVVLMLFGDKLRIYTTADVYNNGTQPPDANFTLLTTISIDGAHQATQYTDNASAATIWYKYTFFNSATSAETSLAYSKAFQAPQNHYISIDQVKDAAGFKGNPNVSDDIALEKLTAAEQEVNGALQGVYDLPLPQPTNPIIVEIVKNIAGGELMAEMYTGVSSKKVAEGNAKSAKGRVGSEKDNTAGLAQLVDRSVVLLDANFAEETREEAHGFGGWPDETTAGLAKSAGGDQGFHFTVDKEY